MTIRPTSFWCIECQLWTTIAENPEVEDDFWCGRCGAYYLCGECGYEIDRVGNCQRDGEGCIKG